MSFFNFSFQAISFHSPQMITHLAEMMLDIELSRRQPQDLAVPGWNRFNTVAWPLTDHRGTIPYVENENASRLDMPPGGPKSSQHVMVFQLIAQHSKHHE